MREISRKEKEKLTSHLYYLELEGVITREQVELAKESYKEKEKISPLSIVLILSSILIGLGLLIAITAIWDDLPSLLQIGVLVSISSAFYFLSHKFRNKLFKTSRAFYYIATFAALMCPEIMNYTFESSYYFTIVIEMLIIGAAAYYRKDSFLSLVYAMMLIKNMTIFSTETIHLLMIIAPFLLLFILYSRKRVPESTSIFIASIILPTIYLLAFFESIDTEEYIQLIVILQIGVLLVFAKKKVHSNIAEWIGTLMIMFSGLFLMTEMIWDGFSEIYRLGLSISFTLILVAIATLMMKKNPMNSIFIFGLVVMELYYNYTFDTMPKSIFFLTSGFILLSIGYFIEKFRRKKADVNEDSNT